MMALASFLPTALMAAILPRADLSLSSTNMVVTEEATATIHLYLPPLPEPYADLPPILNQQPPHIRAGFLEQEWDPAAVKPGDPLAINEGVPSRGDDVRVFTLNDYASADLFGDFGNPFSFFGGDPFESLGPKRRRFPFACQHEGTGKSAVWHFTATTAPFRAKAAGVTAFLPARITVPVIASVDRDRFGRTRAQMKSITLHTPERSLQVSEPPDAGRPASWTGAIGSNVTVSATLDAQVCTAGDPLVLTFTVSGDTDFSLVRAPKFAKSLEGSAFRIDDASVRPETAAGAKRYVYRIRAVTPGTAEFPSLPFSFFNIASRSYSSVRTEPIPVQVKAGTQIALGHVEEANTETDEFPPPDGIDLDFPNAGQHDFTLRRALTQAVRAVTPDDFATAAKAYYDYLSQKQAVKALEDDATLRARHFTNLGALYTMAGNPRSALRAFATAERAVGSTPATTRGIRAAWTRLKNDPRADMPIMRVLFPFWFRLSLRMRIISAAGVAAFAALLFFFAGRAGRRMAALAIACIPLLAPAQSRFANFFFGGADERGGEVKGRARLEPSAVVTGMPCRFVISFESDGDVSPSRIAGLNVPGMKLLADTFEPLGGNSFAIPVFFKFPATNTLNLAISGMQTKARSRANGRFSSTFSSSFTASLPPLRLDVRPLPMAGRPADFAGAVGRNFRLSQTLSPTSVRPGDLVTATYTLSFDGYMPTNILPTLESVQPDFKVYPPKEAKRTASSIEWTQVIIPQTTNACIGAMASVAYYDIAARKYTRARAIRPRLSFVSAQAASTRNTSVMVDGANVSHAPVASGAESSNGPVILHFAPSDASPVLRKLSPGTPVKELSRKGLWRRLEAPDAVGWSRAE